MATKIELNQSHIVLSLATALDLVPFSIDQRLSDHGRRVCYIAMNLGDQLDFPEEQRERLFLAALLHDSGLYSSETAMKNKQLDWAGSFQHCQEGCDLLSRFPRFKEVAKVVLHHHDKWQGPNPSGLAGNEIPLESQIIFMADRIDIMLESQPHVLRQRAFVMERLREVQGTFFNPQLVELFKKIAEREAFWLNLATNEDDMLAKYKIGHIIFLSLEDLKGIAQIFAQIIDKKSTFTKEHSVKVAAIARKIASGCGFALQQRELMEVAGLLHDLGKLAVPDQVLDKPAPLTPDELCFIRSHTYYTYSILDKLEGLAELRDWAAFHHERLDGTGYPFHLDENTLNLGSRIMAVADHLQALAQNRPYRGALSKQAILDILEGQAARKALDPQLVQLVRKDFDELLAA